MINLFKSLKPVNLLFLAVFALFTRIGIFVYLPGQPQFHLPEPNTQVFNGFLNISTLTPQKSVFIALIMVYIQALLFNRLINNHGLLPKSSYLPGLLYITASSLFLPFMVLSAPLISNFLIIWMIDKFIKMSKIRSAIPITFDIGLIIALGTCIYFPFIIFLFIIWLGLLLFRPFNWREWFAGLLGFLTLFFLIAVYYYWNNRLTEFYHTRNLFIQAVPSAFKMDYNDFIILIPITIILILATIQLQKNFFRSFLSTRKAFQLLFFMFLAVIFSFRITPNLTLNHFLLALPSAAVLLAYYFINAKKRWFYESLFILLVICTQYFLLV